MFTRTKLYSVYVNKGAYNPLETAVFIKQGFNFWAFLFTSVWAIYNRLWLIFSLLTIIQIMLAVNDSIQFMLISLLVNIWFGFEANNFKSAKLEKKGYILFDVVTGIDELSASQRFFDRYLFNKQQITIPKSGVSSSDFSKVTLDTI